MNPIRIGTTGWSYKDWVGPFYPPGTKQGDYLAQYAERFDVVEVDSTFYRTPSKSLVQRWADHTPTDFGFALKTPRAITHDQVLVDCEAEMDAFVAAVRLLGPKLRAVLLQFGYFNRQAFTSPRQFFDRLDAFLTQYAAQIPLACEIRNRAWLKPDYFDLLRSHSVSAALVEHAWLPPVEQLLDEYDAVTGPLSYVRLIGDRKGIEEVTTTWERVVVDRSDDLVRVAGAVRQAAERAEVLVFINNHYAGHAPETCRVFRADLEDS